MDNFIPTNTLASTSFDVLKMDAIEDPLININKLVTMDLEESYFALAVEFIKETNAEISNNKVKLYKSITEATSYDVVLESFSDFFIKVKDVIDKFLKFIKSLFDRFVNTIMSLVSSDKYINKNKKLLNNFKSEDNFKYNGFEYTFESNVPLANAALSYNNNLFDDLYTSGTSGTLTVSGVRDIVNNLNFDEDYDKFRGDVLNLGHPVSISAFNQELFKVFRNNVLDTSIIDADKAVVTKALGRFEDYKSIKSELNRSYSELEKSYNTVKKQVQDIVKHNGNMNMKAFIDALPSNSGITAVESNDGFTMSGEFMAQIDIYVKAKTDQIQEYSNIHALAYSAKLDALKECFKQDKNILYTALGRVLRTDYQREAK